MLEYRSSACSAHVVGLGQYELTANKVPIFEQKHDDEAHGFRRRRRAAYAVSLKLGTAEDVKCFLHMNIVPSYQDDNMFLYMGAHEDD